MYPPRSNNSSRLPQAQSSVTRRVSTRVHEYFRTFGHDIDQPLNDLIDKVQNTSAPGVRWPLIIEGVSEAITKLWPKDSQRLVTELNPILKELCRNDVIDKNYIYHSMASAYDLANQRNKEKGGFKINAFATLFTNFLKSISHENSAVAIDNASQEAIKNLSQIQSYSSSKKPQRRTFTRSFSLQSQFTNRNTRPRTEAILDINHNTPSESKETVNITENTYTCNPATEIYPCKIGIPEINEKPIDIDFVFIIPSRGNIDPYSTAGDLPLYTQLESIQAAVSTNERANDGSPKAFVYVGLNTPIRKSDGKLQDVENKNNHLIEVMNKFSLQANQKNNHSPLSKNLAIEVSPFFWSAGSELKNDLIDANEKPIVPYGTIRNAITDAAFTAINQYTAERRLNILPTSKLIFLDGDVKLTSSAISRIQNIDDNEFTSLPFIPPQETATPKPDPNIQLHLLSAAISKSKQNHKNQKIAFDIHWTLANEMYLETNGNEQGNKRVSLNYPAEPCLIVGSDWIEKIKNNKVNHEDQQPKNLFGYYKQEGLNAKDRLESEGFYFGKSSYEKRGKIVSSPHTILTNTERFKTNLSNKNLTAIKKFTTIAAEHSQNLSSIRNYSIALGAGLGVDKNIIMSLSKYFWAPNVIQSCESNFNEAKNFITSLSQHLTESMDDNNINNTHPASLKLVNDLRGIEIEKNINPDNGAYDANLDHNKIIRNEVINNLRRWSLKSIEIISANLSISPTTSESLSTQNPPLMRIEDTENLLNKIDFDTRKDEYSRSTPPNFSSDKWRQRKSTTFASLFLNPKALDKTNDADLKLYRHLGKTSPNADLQPPKNAAQSYTESTFDVNYVDLSMTHDDGKSVEAQESEHVNDVLNFPLEELKDDDEFKNSDLFKEILDLAGVSDHDSQPEFTDSPHGYQTEDERKPPHIPFANQTRIDTIDDDKSIEPQELEYDYDVSNMPLSESNDDDIKNSENYQEILRLAGASDHDSHAELTDSPHAYQTDEERKPPYISFANQTPITEIDLLTESEEYLYKTDLTVDDEPIFAYSLMEDFDFNLDYTIQELASTIDPENESNPATLNETPAQKFAFNEKITPASENIYNQPPAAIFRQAPIAPQDPPHQQIDKMQRNRIFDSVSRDHLHISYDRMVSEVSGFTLNHFERILNLRFMKETLGKTVLAAYLKHTPTLINLGFSADDAITILSSERLKMLEATADTADSFLNSALNFSRQEVVALACAPHKAPSLLYLLKKNLDYLITIATSSSNSLYTLKSQLNTHNYMTDPYKELSKIIEIHIKDANVKY